MKLAAAVALILGMGLPLPAQTRVNADAALLQKFGENVQAYLKLRGSLEQGLPAFGERGKNGAAVGRQRLLAGKLGEARAATKQGDIFSPEIAREFRRVLRLGMQGANNSRIRSSFRSAAPVSLQPKVNSAFPENLPLQSMPPTLLMNLPRLPSGLDYRFAGRTLILRDAQANMVVDFVPDAIAAR